MFDSTNKINYKPYLVILLFLGITGLILAPWLLRAGEPATPQPIQSLETPLNVYPGEAAVIMDDQNLLLVSPQTGPLSIFGRESARGAELALKAWGIGFRLNQADEEERVETQVPNLEQVKVAIGHFSEKSLTRNAPYYIHYKIPVLLPFLENPEVGSLNENFFQLMPDYAVQGRRLAQDVLTQNKKPNQVILVVGPERPQKLLADAFAYALSKGMTIPPSGANKSARKLSPLSSKVKVHRLDISALGELAELKDLKGSSQDVVLLALPPSLAVEAGPVLADSNFRKARYLGGSALGHREVGAEYRALGLNLTLCLPVVPTPKSSAYNVFARRYEYFTKNSPTWPAVLAYDAATLAIKAASVENIKGYLEEPGRPHQGVTADYVFNTGAPAQLLKIDDDTLAFLP
ncbi:MAG: ABC transporter substrate-binding protein [Deltaproteobacteria bacterium]|jgi:ABC-type branched-subunit amino acid transport system substrate-binding protein|nr:ABC transporter substrate-binding protein [Deltaproteobacteria bacterium]